MIRLPTLSPLEHAAFVAAGLLLYVLVTRARQQRRHPYAALAWVLGIAAFPYLGVPLFLLFGTRKTVRPSTPRQPVPAGPWARLAPAWATGLLAALGVPEARPQAALRFHADGAQALAELRALIASAERTLDVCTYVLGDDQVGAAVADELAARARAGVRVRLLVDSVGSLRSRRSHDARLRAAGVRVRRFMPALRNPRRGRTNLRNHRKLVVADGLRLWGGGRNLADEYFIGRAGEAPWIDLSFSAEGALATQAMALFEGDWRIALGLRRASGVPYAERALRHEALLHAYQPADASAAALASAPPAASGAAPSAQVALAHWVPSGPDFHEDVLHALLVSAAFHAQQRLLLATPYFVPDEGLLEALLLAAKRGVRVTLLLPRRSNHRLADWARGRAVRALVEHGVEVRLLPTMLHAKAVVVDQELALCGSANLDSRSLFINYEAMAACYGRAEIDWLAGWITRTAADGEPASARPPGLLRDVLEGVVGALAFQL